MIIQEVCYWIRRTLVDRGWWLSIVGASVLVLCLTVLYAEILTTPAPGEHAQVAWLSLIESSFMAWSFELFMFAVGASLVTGRNWASGAHTVYAWLFPQRCRSVLAIVSGVGLPSMCVATVCSVVAHILLAGFPTATSARLITSAAMVLTSSLSALLASALGAGLAVLTRSTVTSVVSLVVLFWFFPGGLAAAELPTYFLPSAGLMGITLLPLRHGSMEFLVGVGFIFLVLIVAGVVEGRRDIQ